MAGVGARCLGLVPAPAEADRSAAAAAGVGAWRAGLDGMPGEDVEEEEEEDGAGRSPPVVCRPFVKEPPSAMPGGGGRGGRGLGRGGGTVERGGEGRCPVYECREKRGAGARLRAAIYSSRTVVLAYLVACACWGVSGVSPAVGAREAAGNGSPAMLNTVCMRR